MRFIKLHTSIAITQDLARVIDSHYRIMVYHLSSSGIDTSTSTPLIAYFEYVYASSNERPIKELLNGINARFTINNGLLTLQM